MLFSSASKPNLLLTCLALRGFPNCSYCGAGPLRTGSASFLLLANVVGTEQTRGRAGTHCIAWREGSGRLPVRTPRWFADPIRLIRGRRGRVFARTPYGCWEMPALQQRGAARPWKPGQLVGSSPKPSPAAAAGYPARRAAESKRFLKLSPACALAFGFFPPAPPVRIV